MIRLRRHPCQRKNSIFKLRRKKPITGLIGRAPASGTEVGGGVVHHGALQGVNDAARGAPILRPAAVDYLGHLSGFRVKILGLCVKVNGLRS